VIEDLLQEADSNENGVIEYEEFIPVAVALLTSMAKTQSMRTKKTKRASTNSKSKCVRFKTDKGSPKISASPTPPPPPPPPENTMRSMEDLKEYSSEDLKEYLRRLFSIGDTNGDGVLQPSEFKRLLELSGFNFSEETVRQLMSAADVNGDGVIEYDEFIPVGMEVLKAQNKQWSRQPATPPTLPSLKDIAPEVSMID